MSYNPGVSFDLSQITRTGDSLSSTILNAAGVYKQKRAEAKAADALWKALEPAEGDGGEVKPHPFMPKDQWDSLSWADKTSKMSGFIKAAAIKSAMEDQKLQRERAALEQKRLAQVIAAGQAEQDNANALGSVLKAAGPRPQLAPGSITEAMGGGQPMGLPPIQTPAAGAPTPQALIQAAMNYRGAGDPLQASNFRNVANVLQEMNGKQPKGLEFRKSPTGALIALSPDTGMFQFDPLSTSSTRMEMTDYQKQQTINSLWATHDAATTRISGLSALLKSGSPEERAQAQAMIEASKEQQARALAQLKEFGAVRAPAAAPAATGKVRKYNPATGKIE